jgi:hypothetical protein
VRGLIQPDRRAFRVDQDSATANVVEKVEKHGV